MKKNILFTGIYFFCFLLLFSACKKDWLNVKSNKALVVPATLTDLQAILDNSLLFAGSNPAIGELGSADFYVLPATWQALTAPTERNAYIWAADIFEGDPNIDWNNCYQRIFYSNVVLEGINKIIPAGAVLQQWSSIKGSALYYRANNFYNLAQLFCRPFETANADADMGIPLKLTADINEKSVRASVRATYNQIINDLKEAAPLLPTALPTAPALSKIRPSKAAAYGLLARTYLSMRNYDSALVYAGLCLQLNNTLINFNTLNAAATNPIAPFNTETISYTSGVNYLSFFTTRLIVDSTLYRSYAINDLRRSIFFFTTAGNISYKGSYTQTRLIFTGIATDEMYLVRAECQARRGNTAAALMDLNALLITRWRTGTFVPITAIDANDALAKILTERRKELVFRGLRWTDLRRLNLENANITLTRVLNASIYTLPPNDKKYILPIPDNEIQLSGIAQNPR